MSRLLPALVAALLALALASPALAQEPATDRLGPLPQRVRHPLYLLHLQPSPGRATTLEPGSVSIDLNGDWTNVWERWRLTVDGGKEIIDFDLEILRLGATVRVGLPLGMDVGLEVPLITMGGGVADRSIQSWHDALGVDNGGRNRVENFEFSWGAWVPGQIAIEVEEPPVMAVGDIVLDLKGRLLRPTGSTPGVTARFLLKLPTGSLERGTGSGMPDVGIVLMAEHGWGPFNLYAQLGALGLGRPPALAQVMRSSSLTWALAAELMLTPWWSVVVQVQSHTSFHRPFAYRYLVRSPLGLMFGTRVRLGPVDLSVAMEQDPLNGDPTGDVSVIGSVGVTFDRPSRSRPRRSGRKPPEAAGTPRLWPR